MIFLIFIIISVLFLYCVMKISGECSKIEEENYRKGIK